MADTEARKAAGGVCYADALITGAAGVTALAAGPRLLGVAKVVAAGALGWAGYEPDSDRMKVAAAVSAGLAAVNLAIAFGPGLSARKRALLFAGAAFDAIFAGTYAEASRDL